MRFSIVFIFLAMLLPGPAWAAQLALPGTQAETPAKPSAPTIIPGSPLATLTGAGGQTKPPAPPPAPFGTDKIGFALTAMVGNEATRTFNDFAAALQHSTRLEPVQHWLENVLKSAQRRDDVQAILRGIAVAILPGLLLEATILLLLRKPAQFCARQAMPDYGGGLPDPDHEDLVEPSVLEDSEQARRLLSLHALFRRLGLGLLKFVLMLLPLAVFVITEQLFLSSGLIANRAAYLAITGFTNAYIALRFVQEMLRLLLSPKTPSLRLIRLSTRYARWTMSRAMVLCMTIFASFCLVSGMEILGLSKDGAGALIRLAALVVHLEIALGIWQSRRVISRWIAGRPGAEGVVAGLRQRFAKIWYVFALFYVIALWVAWAAGVHNAVGLMLRAVLVVFAALLLGRLAWAGSNNLLARLLPDADTAPDQDGTSLRKRARAYNPLLRALVRAVIGLLVLALMFQGWGVNAFSWLLTNTISRALLSALSSVVITAAVAILCWEVCNLLLDRRVEKLNASGRPRQAARLQTLTPMLKAALGVVIVLVALIVSLSRIGVNTTGLLAVSSGVGIAVGFGSQKLVQDIITGLFLLFEDAMQVGDIVTLASMSGTVERLSIRTIRLRGFDGSVNLVPFSSVTTVTNQTRDFSFAQLSIMVGYEEDIDRVTAVLKELGAAMRADTAWGAMMRDDLELFGLDSFAELGLVFTGRIRTVPGQQWAVRREFYARVQKRFAQEGIELPYRRQTFSLDMPAEKLGPG
jgi:small conductance mechanosensitive channel